MLTHQLPDDSEDVLLVTFGDVLCSQADKLNLELLGALNALITVLSGLEHVLGLLRNLRPINDAGLDLIHNL